MKKILFISGSPRKGMNCEKMAEYAEGIAKEKGFETEKILVSETKVSPCIVCNKCKDTGKCVIDPTSDEVNSKLEQADAIFIVSPVYFGSMSAQLKCIFDKTRPLRGGGFKLKNKIGAVCSVGKSRNGGQEFTIQAVHSWMHIQSMVIVGDTKHFGGICYGDVSEDKKGMETVKETIENVCELLK